MSRSIGNEFTERHAEAAAAWVFRRTAGLTVEEQAAFERWQAADPRHRAALACHERVWSELDRPRKTGQMELLLAKLADRAARRHRRRVAGMGAVVALLLAGAIFWPEARQPSWALPQTRALVVWPERQTLEDGSIVELRSGAEIAVDFNGAFRRVSLRRGEAHFQVFHDSRPFVVVAGSVEFRAVGTAFNVQLAGGQVELLVTEGRVAIEHEATKREANEKAKLAKHPAADERGPAPTPVVVPAGNRMVVGQGPEVGAVILSPTAVLPDEMAERLAWRELKLEFTETPLREAVALMNRHNAVTLVIEDAELGTLPVSGLFRADRTEAFVRLLEANFEVRAEPIGRSIRLHRKR